MYLIYYNQIRMKILMDADCLIKLTKAGLKETVVDHVTVLIPFEVKVEVVDAGLVRQLPDAMMVRNNIEKKKITVLKGTKRYRNGDLALMEEFRRSGCHWIGTDDAKLIRFLKAEDIPFVVPAILVYHLWRREVFQTFGEALKALNRLKPWISQDEYSLVKILMEGSHEH